LRLGVRRRAHYGRVQGPAIMARLDGKNTVPRGAFI
jgi:hypothetical protein